MPQPKGNASGSRASKIDHRGNTHITYSIILCILYIYIYELYIYMSYMYIYRHIMFCTDTGDRGLFQSQKNSTPERKFTPLSSHQDGFLLGSIYGRLAFQNRNLENNGA